MTITPTLEELPQYIGQVLGQSDWFLIDQKRVNDFADATGDHQWIHIDVERATKEIGGTIAHGYLTLSLIPFLSKDICQVQGVSRGINYGLNKVRFTNMVKTGSKIRLSNKLIEVTARAGGLQMTVEVTIEVEGEVRPACVAETVSLLYA